MFEDILKPILDEEDWIEWDLDEYADFTDLPDFGDQVGGANVA